MRTEPFGSFSVWTVTLSSCWRVPNTQPDHLCILFVRIQAITGHPVTDLRDALRQTIRRIRMVCGWHAHVDADITFLLKRLLPWHNKHTGFSPEPWSSANLSHQMLSIDMAVITWQSLSTSSIFTLLTFAQPILLLLSDLYQALSLNQQIQRIPFCNNWM